MTVTNATKRPAEGLHDLDIAVAPECAPDLLAAAPLLFTKGGHEYIDLQGGTPPADPDEPSEPTTFCVLERKDLYGAGITMTLVQQRESKAVYIFPTPEQAQVRTTCSADSLQRSRVNMPALSDVLCEANALHDVLIQTCTDDLIEETAPIVMAVAWELRSKMATPDGNERTEVFGSLLALWAMLKHPEAIQAATQRLFDRLCEELGDEDTEMIALLRGRR